MPATIRFTSLVLTGKQHDDFYPLLQRYSQMHARFVSLLIKITSCEFLQPTLSREKATKKGWKSKLSGVLSLTLRVVLDDFGEAVGGQGRAAHEAAVDVGHAHDFLDVVRLDGPAVLNDDLDGKRNVYA
jgi:hypothetical protein